MRRWLAGVALVLALLLVGGVALGLRGLQRLEDQVESRFRGRLFAVPSRIYSGPLVLYPGLELEASGLRERLERLNYQPVTGRLPAAGEYRTGERELWIGRRAFRYPHRDDPGGALGIRLDARGRIRNLVEGDGRELGTAEIEPERIAELHGPHRQGRRIVRLERVPPPLVDAILAIEDQRFYAHRGVDPRRILGAAIANLRAGRVVQGGSTLTQQLVKNFYLTRARNFSRKLREAVMAVLLERNHTKREILEAYLNEAYMGQRGSVEIHGVGEAARHYFAKDVESLSLAESALLAAVIKGPRLYSPYLDPRAAEERRNLVLSVLHEGGSIDEEAFAEALAAPLGVRGMLSDDNPAPYFVEFLRQDLARVYGPEILESEGLSVFTTLDPRLQRIANRAVTDGLARLERAIPELRREESPLEAAVVVLAPRSGEVLAMVGGREFGRSQFNRATQAHRQPGSVFKPVVALTALARTTRGPPAFTPVSLLEDEPLRVAVGGREWTPANYDGEFRGTVRLRQAIEQSLNVPVARLGLALGPEAIIRTARRMGIESRLEPVPSLALGAFEMTLLEIARTYAVLASGGVVPVVRSYAEVVDAEGRVLERKPLDFVRAFEPAETWLVTSLLRGAVERGTGQPLRRLGVEGPVAGKTGTTSDFRDGWFIGYTQELLVGVWVGFDDGASLGVPGSVSALPICASILREAVDPDAPEAPVPPGIEWVRIDPASGLRGGAGCRGSPEPFLEGTAPRESCAARSPRPIDRILDWLWGRS